MGINASLENDNDLFNQMASVIFDNDGDDGMLNIFSYNTGKVMKSEIFDQPGLWVHLVDPTPEEITDVSTRFGIKPTLISASLDFDKNSRIEVGEDQLLILINIPYREDKGPFVTYNTMPFGMIFTEQLLLTVALKDNEVIHRVVEVNDQNIKDKTTLAFLILSQMIELYQKYLKEIERKSTVIEQYINKSLKNEELIKLVNLEQSLVYFSTALSSNEMVLEKLLNAYLRKRHNEKSMMIKRILEDDEERREYLEDLIVENKQAMTLIDIYTNILSNTMDAFASIISNNLNIVMRFLTMVTIALAIPSIVTGFFGMSIPLPFQSAPFAYLWVGTISVLLIAVITLLISKKRF
jgi:magnesium transporter